MTSDRIIKQAIRLLSLIVSALMLSSCNNNLQDYPPILNNDMYYVGPDGGHLEIATTNYSSFGIDIIKDKFNNIIWHQGNYKDTQYLILLEGMKISHNWSHKIDIDISPSDTMNKWYFDIRFGDIFGGFSIIQNGE